MTTSEFKNEFLIHYNAIATNSAPGLDDYEISVFLTKAQLEIVKNYYNPEGNKYKDGFENSEKRRTDLKELVKDHKSTTIISSNTGISNGSKFFKIPNDVFLIVHEYAKVSSSDCLNNELISVYVKTHDEYTTQINNPFKNPDRSTVWRLNTSMIGNDKVVEILSPYNISTYQLRYIKYPRPIVLSDLSLNFPGEGLSIDGVTSPQTSELDQEIHREIIDRAVQIALRDYKPANLESKVQLDLRNE
jgi:hypothetical protein